MKKFDAVKMVREIRDKIYTETKKLSDKEVIEYYRQKAKKSMSVRENSRPYGSD